MGYKLRRCPVEKHLGNIINLQMKWRKLVRVLGTESVKAGGPLINSLAVFMPVFVYLCNVVVVLLELARGNTLTNFFWLRVKCGFRVVQLVSGVCAYFLFSHQKALGDLRVRMACRSDLLEYRRELRVFGLRVRIPRSGAHFLMFYDTLIVFLGRTLFDCWLDGRLGLSFGFRQILMSFRFGSGDRACPLCGSGDYLPHGWFFFALI